MLDVDLGPALVFFVVVFVALPIGVAGVATAGILNLIRNPTRRLAVGTYVMLVCTAAAPAPIVWGDNHLGFASSQALEGFSALFWIVGAISSVGALSGVIKRRHVLLLDFGLTLTALLICGWALGGIGPAFSLAFVPAVGTIELLLVLTWLAHRFPGVASAIDWRWAATVGLTSAATIAAYVYLRGPQAFGAQANAMDLLLLAMVVWLPVPALARLQIKSDHLPA